jgi:hypothetical protein
MLPGLLACRAAQIKSAPHFSLSPIVRTGTLMLSLIAHLDTFASPLILPGQRTASYASIASVMAASSWLLVRPFGAVLEIIGALDQ